MRKIVVPTDFSPTSSSAMRFAAFLGQIGGYEVEVVHIHDGYGHTDDPRVKKGDLTASTNVKNSLEDFIRFSTAPAPFEGEGEVAIFPPLKIREETGTPDAVLLAISKETDTALVVMGGVGASSVSTTSPMFGSTAKSVALNAGCPVLLIPRDYGTPEVNTVAIAFSETKSLQETSDQADFLLSLLKPAIRLVHVKDSDTVREGRKELDLLNTALKTGFPDYPVDLDLLPPSAVSSALISYVNDYSIDLLVLGRRQRGLFSRLFLRSEISPLLDVSPAPMLIVPISNY